VAYSGTSSSGTLTASEGTTTVHLNIAGTNMGAFGGAGLDSSGTGLLIHDPAADPAEQHHVADGTLDGAAASDSIDVTSQGNYPGVLTVSPNGKGGADWHFAASDNDIAQEAGQTRNYMVQDLTTPSASQALSVSIGGSGQDQFSSPPAVARTRWSISRPRATASDTTRATPSIWSISATVRAAA
jgi:hypothetical protein